MGSLSEVVVEEVVDVVVRADVEVDIGAVLVLVDEVAVAALALAESGFFEPLESLTVVLALSAPVLALVVSTTAKASSKLHSAPTWFMYICKLRFFPLIQVDFVAFVNWRRW